MKVYAFVFTNVHSANHCRTIFALAKLETSKSYFAFNGNELCCSSSTLPKIVPFARNPIVVLRTMNFNIESYFVT